MMASIIDSEKLFKTRQSGRKKLTHMEGNGNRGLISDKFLFLWKYFIHWYDNSVCLSSVLVKRIEAYSPRNLQFHHKLFKYIFHDPHTFIDPFLLLK